MWFYGHGAFLSGRVVHDGSVGAVAGDGVKRRLEITGLLRAVFCEYVGYVKLGQGYAFGHTFLDFHESSYQGCAVILHGTADSLGLHGVFGGLEHGDRGGSAHGAATEGVTQPRGGAPGLDKHSGAFGQGFQEACDGGVGSHGHAVLCQISLHFFVDFLLFYKKGGAGGGQVEEGCGHGGAAHVGAAYVEHPRCFGEVGHQESFGALLGCLLEHGADFVGCGSAGIFHIVDEHGVAGELGAVGPYGVDGGEGGIEFQAAPAEGVA